VDEERVFLEQLLRVLPEEQRTAVETFAAGWPDEQIAAALGKSPGAVRVLRFRAVRKLREMLGEDTEAERRP
jgi:DNA-directed RNA polymerase specialized sigma24 family protein